MQLVVLLRGVNVGGHRTFRPARLAAELRHLDAVNIGAAGTFVIRKAASRQQVRDEFTRKLPFATELIICSGRELRELMSGDFFSNEPERPDITRFVMVLSRRPRLKPPMPMILPDGGKWHLKILATKGPFVIGLYRRDMKAIGYLGKLDRMFGLPATTRNWNTITAIGRVLEESMRRTGKRSPRS